jgi:pilus assembly protein CpaC
MKNAQNRNRFFAVVLVILSSPLFSNSGKVFAANEMKRTTPQSEQLTVAVNQTVILDFEAPIKRAAIVNEKIAEVSVLSPKSIMVSGKAFGFTQMVLWNDNESQMIYDIRVDVDMEQLAKLIKETSPQSTVKVSTLWDTVVLSGNVPDAPTASRIIDLAKVFSTKVQNQLSVAGSQQVLLRATVAEVSRGAVKALGLNGTFFGAKAFGGSNVGNINPTSIGLTEKTLVPINTPNQFQVTGGDIAVGSGTTMYFGLPKAQMELFLQAMQENSLVKVLAEPNLVAISGQQAEFLAGGELPIPTPNENGIAITFREYGVRLKFQPVVQAGQIIRLTVTSEVSEPDYTNAVQIEGYTVPGISKRTASTVVEVGSGQTFAIAGLLSDRVNNATNKVPGVGDIPVLGALFRSVNFERRESELMILITPDLASPMNAGEATYYPGKDVRPPNDWELYGLGVVEGKKETPETCMNEPKQPCYNPPGPLCGPWGLQSATNEK